LLRAFGRSGTASTRPNKENSITILTNAAPIILVCTRNVPETAAFYRGVLGLTQRAQDKYAAAFRTGGVDMRISLVPDFVTNGHTVMGFRVSDIMAAVQALREKGI
jgi:hypothetical protein